MSFTFIAKDLNWIYSEKTGALPFIINNNQNKVKLLFDNTIVEITEKHKCSNPKTAAKNALSEHFKQDMDYVNSTAIFAQVKFLKNLQHFGAQTLGEDSQLTMEQIKFLSDNYTKKIRKIYQKEKEEKQKKQQYEKEKEKIFDF